MNEFGDEGLIGRLERLGELKPAPEATRQAVDRARRALGTDLPARLPWRRKIMLKHFAVAALVLLGTGTLLAWLLRSPSPAQAGFAEVQAAMKSSRSVTFRQVTRIKGKPEETSRNLILGNGLLRDEQPDGSYTVVDTGKYRALLVNPQKREATLFNGWNVPQVNLYEKIKNLPSDASARALPGKKIDGKDALGFVVKMQGYDLTVWADATTRLPVRMEAEDKDDKGKKGEVIMDQFVFDKELDAKLFSLEPPAGYRLETKGVAELPAAPADPQFKDLIVTPLVGIGPVKFGMARAEVERLLGKPDAVQEMGQRGTVNLNYGSRGFFISVGKQLGVLTISCVAQKIMAIRVRDFSGKTDKGIALGAKKGEIVRVYGKPDRDETNQGTTYLSFNKLQADFTLVGDRLVQMMFRRPRPAN